MNPGQHPTASGGRRELRSTFVGAHSAPAGKRVEFAGNLKKRNIPLPGAQCAPAGKCVGIRRKLEKRNIPLPGAQCARREMWGFAGNLKNGRFRYRAHTVRPLQGHMVLIIHEPGAAPYRLGEQTGATVHPVGAHSVRPPGKCVEFAGNLKKWKISLPGAQCAPLQRLYVTWANL